MQDIIKKHEYNEFKYYRIVFYGIPVIQNIQLIIFVFIGFLRIGFVHFGIERKLLIKSKKYVKLYYNYDFLLCPGEFN
jgi:hypothetical protein